MEKKNFKKSDELISLNENLYNEFSLEKLEERLETDPLVVIADLTNDGSAETTGICPWKCIGKDCEFSCGDFTSNSL